MGVAGGLPDSQSQRFLSRAHVEDNRLLITGPFQFRIEFFHPMWTPSTSVVRSSTIQRLQDNRRNAQKFVDGCTD